MKPQDDGSTAGLKSNHSKLEQEARGLWEKYPE